MLEQELDALKDDAQGTLHYPELDTCQIPEDHGSEVSLGIIKICEDGTLTTKVHLPDGREVYLAMQKIDDNWRKYKLTSVELSRCLAKIAGELGCVVSPAIKFYEDGLYGDISIEEFQEKILHIREKFEKHKIFQKDNDFSDADFVTGFQNLIGLEGKEFDNFVNMFKNALKERPKIQGVLEAISSAVVRFESDWITYASNEPIRGKLQMKSDPIPDGKFKLLAEDFGSIIISVQTAQYPNDPAFQNSMIFKNPYYLIKGERYDRLSMVLHSFAAKVAQEFWKDKIYMTVSPIPKMQEIILASLREGDLFIGDNKHKPYPNFPPLLHESKQGRLTVIKIAKEGVDASEYANSELPDELTQFTQTVDCTKSSPTLAPDIFTVEGYKNYIRISALTKFFERYCPKNIP